MPEPGAWDRVLERVPEGTKLRTPDAKVGQEFVVDKVDAEGVDVKTQRGGRIRTTVP